MVPFLCSLAWASDPDVAAVYRRHPAPLELIDVDEHLVVQDALGQTLSNEQALRLVDPELAGENRRDRRSRKVVANIAFTTGSVLTTTSVVCFLTEAPAAPVLLLGGVTLIGGGVAALNVDVRPHLEQWVSREALEGALGSPPSASAGPPRTDRDGVFPTWELRDGRVRDTNGRVVHVRELAAHIGDLETLEAIAVTRRRDTITWGALTATGTALVVAGEVGAMQAADMRTYSASLATAGFGGVMAAGGLVGLVVSAREHGKVGHWFDEAEVLEEIERHNKGESHATPRPQAARLSARPVVGFGYLGLEGSF